ncbi:MAG: hypothetical protein E7Z88_02730 [Cyanobacteria bacterium SIG27]|nr:hypothetical protein [Cyanobacteria bacterium SIG27]
MEEQYFSRWYDKDPVLSMSMRTLANSSDESQIAVALNLIKIIIEHNIQDNKYENVEDIVNAVEDGRIQRGHSRWYDIDSTVRTAIQMLERCSAETKKKVALDMAQLVIEKIIQDDDLEEIKQEEQNLVEIDGKEIDLDLDK